MLCGKSRAGGGARPLWPYLALMLALTVVIALVPGVVLWLPDLLGY